LLELQGTAGVGFGGSFSLLDDPVVNFITKLQAGVKFSDFLNGNEILDKEVDELEFFEEFAVLVLKFFALVGAKLVDLVGLLL